MSLLLCKPSTWHHVLSISLTPFAINYTIQHRNGDNNRLNWKLYTCDLYRACCCAEHTIHPYYFTHSSSDKSFIETTKGKSISSHTKFWELHILTKFDCSPIIEMNSLQLNIELYKYLTSFLFMLLVFHSLNIKYTVCSCAARYLMLKVNHSSSTCEKLRKEMTRWKEQKQPYIHAVSGWLPIV